MGTPFADHQPVVGPRPAEFPKDMAGIADLIELCFQGSLDSSGLALLRRARALASSGSFAWQVYRRLGSSEELDWFHGFVWTESGRIVGNVSLALSRAAPRTWAIANVAVHPASRGRGIARALTLSALAEARELGAERAVLQVKTDNSPALALYLSLGFREVTRRALWNRPRGFINPTEEISSGQDLEEPSPRRSGEWREEYELAKRVHPEGLAWTSPLTLNTFRPTLWRFLIQVMSGDRESHWMLRSRGQLIAILWTLQRFGTLQALTVVDPQWNGRAEAVLLSRALRSGGWDQEFALEIPPAGAEEDLIRLGFRKGRTLVWMEKDLRAHPQNEVGRVPAQIR
ncbi:MAG: GNAT family N-acetyltransferase [Anaerolineales bacterium]|jgi:ribosomal protein S18 acetylase RimI-like enzyme